MIWTEEKEDGSHDTSLLDCKLGYFFHHLLIPKCTSFFNKVVIEYKYKNSDDKAQEAVGDKGD